MEAKLQFSSERQSLTHVHKLAEHCVINHPPRFVHSRVTKYEIFEPNAAIFIFFFTDES